MLTIGTTGTNGDSTRGVVPGAEGGNNAVDTFLPFSNGASNTRSSPFVVYDADVAFVGDDHGFIHKFNGVFNGTLTEQGGAWPARVGSELADDTILTSPVFFADRIFVGGANGKLYCLTAVGVPCSPVSSLDVGTDAPFSIRRSWMAAPGAYSWRLRMRQGQFWCRRR